jgi:spermidine synthase
MRRYNGELIHASRDEHGPIEVVEDGRVRSLHFGSRSRQSALFLDRPEALVLAYTQSMMASLLLHSAPRRVLLVGLGGGSLARFLLHHYPDCHIDAVELRPRVVELAHGYFRLPEDDARLTIIPGEGRQFLTHAALRHSDYDLILVDAFHGTGMAEEVAEADFFAAARGRLADEGALAVNLWQQPAQRLRRTLTGLRDAFAGRCLQLPVPTRGNLVALASTRPVPPDFATAWDLRAHALSRFTGLDFPGFLEGLSENNSSI